MELKSKLQHSDKKFGRQAKHNCGSQADLFAYADETHTPTEITLSNNDNIS